MPRPLAVSTALFDGYPMELALAEIAGAGVAFAEPAFIAGYVDFDETSFSPAAAKHLAAAMAAAGLSAIAVVAVTRYVSLASILTALLGPTLVVVLAFMGKVPEWWAAGVVGIGIIIVIQHRQDRVLGLP